MKSFIKKARGRIMSITRKLKCKSNHENLSLYGAEKINKYEHDNIFRCDDCGIMVKFVGNKMLTGELLDK